MHVASVEVSNGPATSATSSGEGRVLSDEEGWSNMHVASVEVSNGPATSATSSGEGRVLSDGGGVFFCSSSLSSPFILIPKPLDSPGDDAARVPKPIAPFVPEPNTVPKLAVDAKPVEENALLDSC